MPRIDKANCFLWDGSSWALWNCSYIYMSLLYYISGTWGTVLSFLLYDGISGCPTACLIISVSQPSSGVPGPSNHIFISHSPFPQHTSAGLVWDSEFMWERCLILLFHCLCSLASSIPMWVLAYSESKERVIGVWFFLLSFFSTYTEFSGNHVHYILCNNSSCMMRVNLHFSINCLLLKGQSK